MMFCFFSALVEQPSTDRNLLEALSYLHFRYVQFFVKAHLGKYPIVFFLSLSLRSLWWIILVLASLQLAKVEPFLVGVEKKTRLAEVASLVLVYLWYSVKWDFIGVHCKFYLEPCSGFTRSPAAFIENMMGFKCLLVLGSAGRSLTPDQFLYRVFFFVVARMNVGDYKIAKLLNIGLNSKMKIVPQPSIFGLQSLHNILYNISINTFHCHGMSDWGVWKAHPPTKMKTNMPWQ